MPTYEYECTSCGQHIEVFQRFAEDPLTTCGACGGRLRKVFHPAGIVFKGSGFYSTDSRSGSRSDDKKDTKDDKKDATKETKKEAGAGSSSPASSSSSPSSEGGSSSPAPKESSAS
jgi:putative FmdB family regulatory protein